MYVIQERFNEQGVWATLEYLDRFQTVAEANAELKNVMSKAPCRIAEEYVELRHKPVET